MENSEKNRAGFDLLTQLVPMFHVNGSDIEIIDKPSEFYEKLLDLIRSSKNRIVLSSLYFGTGNLEQRLIDAIGEALSQNEALKVTVLLDFSRGTRGHPNSCTMFHPLIRQFAQRLNVYLFHTPILRGFLKVLLPGRWNEIMGVQHMKLYMFDDNLIISGANLNDLYFTRRQDRYMLIKNCHNLVNFYQEIVHTVGSCSFTLDGEQIVLNKDCDEHPFQGSFELFCMLLKERLTSVIEKWRKRCFNPPPDDSAKDTIIYPLMQMGPIDLNTEDNVITDVLSGRSISEQCQMAIASGYFNLTTSYMDIILNKSQHAYDILMSCPKANGFFNGSGLSKFIPSAYVYISRKFFETVQIQRQSDRILLFEYCRDNWTFHAKGIWMTAKGENLPFATFVGSTNYGYRSVHRDLETQIVVVTKNELLKRRLQEEKERLWSYSYPVDSSVFKRTDHHVPLWVRFVTRFVKQFF